MVSDDLKDDMFFPLDAGSSRNPLLDVRLNFTNNLKIVSRILIRWSSSASCMF